MRNEPSAQDVIKKYQKRQNRAPVMFVLGAILLIAIFTGAVIGLQYYVNPDAAMFESFRDTATPTNTATVTQTPIPPTATATETPTPEPPTETPTITPTPTIDGPFDYQVRTGESIFSIAEKFGIDINYLLEVNGLAFDDVIVPGQTIFIPDRNVEPPTATPLPEGLPPGYLIEYTVKAGDFLGAIADKFNTTIEAILEANEDLEDANGIFPGQVLSIPVNLVSPSE